MNATAWATPPKPAPATEPLRYSYLVDEFYTLNQQHLHWYTTSPSSTAIRERFRELIDSSRYLGLDADKYRYPEPATNPRTADADELMRLDRKFTDAIIAFYKDVYQGCDIARWIRNDEISEKYAAADNNYLLKSIAKIEIASDVDRLIATLEPASAEYKHLRDELRKHIDEGSKTKTAELISTVNLFRWIHHFQFSKLIVVNIPSATLGCYETGNMKLQMKVVVGKTSTKSPRFSTWCNQVILYPYWNVPRSIAVKELFPRFKRSPASIDKMNMQVIGSNGKVVNPNGIDWAAYNRYSFPYSFRQCTGCDNSLGVIKFNLTDPFDVYLHDTNFKLAFLKSTRFLSHGCIRVEKPIELGNYILDNKLDSNFLKACYKDQTPVTIKLNEKVPVFVVYMPVESTADTIIYHPDVYRLFR